MALTLTGHIAAADPLLDTDLRDLDIVSTDEGCFLYATTGQNGGMSVYQLEDGQLAHLTDSAYFTVSGMGVGRFEAVMLDGRMQLILQGAGDGRLLRYQPDADGAPGKAGTIDLPGQGDETPGALAGQSLSGGLTALYAVEADSGALGGWVSSGTGQLVSAVARADGAGAFALSGAVALETVAAGNRHFLLAADAAGAHVFRIDTNTGTLKATDTLGAADGLGIAIPTALETVTAFGSTWALLGAAGSQSISVMKLSPGGRLSTTDHLLDTANTRFGGISALEVVEAKGHVFVLAAGADDGMSLFQLTPEGRLIHVETLEHALGLGLENVTDLAAQTMGDLVQIFATSASTGGIAQFSLAVDDLGEVIRPAGAGRGPVTGTAGDDVILSRAGASTLEGLAGDDMLVAGPGGGVLTGGAGADTFILCPTEQSLKITDFERGIDHLDLSAFPMLRSPGQLAARVLDDGIRLSFRDTTVQVLSQDGGPLELDDLWPDGFATPDRMLIPDGPSKTRTLGTQGDDRLTGTIGADTIRARGGDDRVTGADGKDRLAGGTGQDRIDGGAGRDRIKGQGGRDDLDGGTGADRLMGGKGRDVLEGGAGNDRLSGNAGADEFRFAEGHGRDRITDFKPGEDILHLITEAGRFRDLDIRDTGADTVIETPEGTIILEGVEAKDIKASDVLME